MEVAPSHIEVRGEHGERLERLRIDAHDDDYIDRRINQAVEKYHKEL